MVALLPEAPTASSALIRNPTVASSCIPELSLDTREIHLRLSQLPACSLR